MKMRTENMILTVFILAVAAIAVASFAVRPWPSRTPEYSAWCKAFSTTNLTMQEWTLLRERGLLPTSVNK